MDQIVRQGKYSFRYPVRLQSTHCLFAGAKLLWDRPNRFTLREATIQIYR